LRCNRFFTKAIKIEHLSDTSHGYKPGFLKKPGL
jgi:hypothetical protein